MISLTELNKIAAGRTPWLWKSVWICWAISIPLLLLTWIDPRLINDISVWIKPWKFHVSVGLHLLTLALAAALLPSGYQRCLYWLTLAALGSTAFELVYITGRASVGLPSHFAVSTPFSSAMYTLMGVAAVVLNSCPAILGGLILAARDFRHGAVVRWGVGMGLILGSVLGTAAGAYLGGQGSHWVGGTPSDANGLWLFHWSRDGGDLRVAHFFGLHAMQVIPLLSLFLARRWRASRALPFLAVFSLAYTGLTLFTFVQARSGQSIVGLPGFG